MRVDEGVRDEIINAITTVGEAGATITELEKEASYERHTLSKYLHLLANEGVLKFKEIGRAKLWYLNEAPLQMVLNNKSKNRTFSEKILNRIITNIPQGLFIVNEHYEIQFMNDLMIQKYEDIHGKLFYKEVLDAENPLKLNGITDLIDRKKKKADVEVEDKFGDKLHIDASLLDNGTSRSLILLTKPAII